MSVRIDVCPCRSCRARIFWATTTKGNRIPVNADPDPTGNLILLPSSVNPIVQVCPDGEALFPVSEENVTYTSHFATCPQADTWRNRS